MSQPAVSRQRQAFLAVVIVGGLIMGAALGARHVQGLFLVPVTLDRSWSREVFGFAVALQNLVWGLTQPFVGMIADRFGSARVLVAGCLLYALGLATMSWSSTPLVFTVSTGVMVGVALSCTSFGLVYGALSRIVPEENRAWALAMAGAVGGLGQFLMVPFAQQLIQAVGWAVALLVISVVIVLLMPGSVLLRDKSDTSAKEGSTTMAAAVSQAFRHRGFLLLNAGFLACGFQLAFIATHMPAYLLDKGVSAATAVNGLAIIAFTNILGSYWCGLLGGLYRRKLVLAGVYLARSLAIAVFVLLPPSALTVYLFCAAMGFLWLGTVPLTNGLVSQVFGVRYISTLFGFVFFGHQVGAFAGAWLGGVVFDATGSYNSIWLMAVVLGLVAAALHVPINDARLEALSPRVAA